MGGVGPVQPQHSPQRPGKTDATSGEFLEAVRDASRSKTPEVDVTISAHASQRLLQRGVMLDQQDLVKINRAMDQAQAKGAKESLFLMRDLALIVSVENRTVITALQGQQAKENVFTQIDSAVLID
ncbi:MAG TPA: flagellar biosynthesis protein [Bacteroidetes bacterium]|nr:flagellar biosynthesis protein [Bacteroidota bacterium]HEX04785.1 flagellar biosynthesis protein [Bacteroidota bacterium]